MRTLAIAFACLALPTLAHARPITAGVGIGHIKSDNAYEGLDTLQLFGRLGFTPRVSGQLELQKIDLGSEYATARNATALLVVDLGSGGRVMPTMFAGIGIDRMSDSYAGGESKGSHIEGGFGLEYRADGGFTIGADVRLGGRSIDDEDIGIQPLAEQDNVALYYAPLLEEGEYRSFRVFAGVRF